MVAEALIEININIKMNTNTTTRAAIRTDLELAQLLDAVVVTN